MKLRFKRASLVYLHAKREIAELEKPGTVENPEKHSTVEFESQLQLRKLYLIKQKHTGW